MRPLFSPEKIAHKNSVFVVFKFEKLAHLCYYIILPKSIMFWEDSVAFSYPIKYFKILKWWE